jgi:hypothetical protein
MVRRRKGKTQRETGTTKSSQRRSRQRIPTRSESTREHSLKALWAMRQGDSLSKAARDNGVTIRTIKRYVGSALVQDRRGGRIRATKSDRLVRYLQIPGSDGPKDITVRGSKAASQFASYKAAVNRLLGGDRDAMVSHGMARRFRELS